MRLATGTLSCVGSQPRLKAALVFPRPDPIDFWAGILFRSHYHRVCLCQKTSCLQCPKKLWTRLPRFVVHSYPVRATRLSTTVFRKFPTTFQVRRKRTMTARGKSKTSSWSSYWLFYRRPRVTFFLLLTRVVLVLRRPISIERVLLALMSLHRQEPHQAYYPVKQIVVFRKSVVRRSRRSPSDLVMWTTCS